MNNLGSENFEVWKANDEFSELQNTQADYALMVYVFHYIIEIIYCYVLYAKPFATGASFLLIIVFYFIGKKLENKYLKREENSPIKNEMENASVLR